MSALFSKLVHDFDAEEWNEYDLPSLRVIEIQALCKLLGAPKSGKKEEIVTRLLAVRHVRKLMAPFAASEQGVAELVFSTRKEKLKWCAKEAGVWRSGNKSQLAVCLINWREKARYDGRKFYDLLVGETKARGVQLSFPF